MIPVVLRDACNQIHKIVDFLQIEETYFLNEEDDDDQDQGSDSS
jgi:hypothetical protein